MCLTFGEEIKLLFADQAPLKFQELEPGQGANVRLLITRDVDSSVRTQFEP